MAMKVPSFNGFVNLTYILLYGSDDLFDVAFLCVREPEVIDYGHCFMGEAKGECLYLFNLRLLVEPRETEVGIPL